MNKATSTKRIMGKAICLAVIVLSASLFVHASQASDGKEHENHTKEKGSELQLSHDLKALLNQEMNEIENGMMQIIPAIAAGDWETITDIAIRIKDSFILKQKLTEKQIEELHRSLPTEFVAMDQDYHATAEKLAHSAHRQEAELVNFYFYKLHSQCIKCHAEYATERFPGLRKNEHAKGGQH